MPTHTAYAVPIGSVLVAYAKPAMLTIIARKNTIVGTGA